MRECGSESEGAFLFKPIANITDYKTEDITYKMVNKQYSATDLEAFMKIAANWQNSNHNLLEGVDIKSEMQQYMNNPAMNMYKKRERTQNWNHQEKKFLLDLCRKDMRIIENKRLDAGLTAVKNKAWKIIHQKFSSQFGTDRTCNRLKEQWRRMKACTRNEILDYNNRLTRFGAEVADRKKPSPFTFEVWEFMQEAKKACKSEALDGIDYSKIPLALEEDYEYRDDEPNVDEEHDMDDSRTPPQDLCDVDIKEETSETFNDTYNNNNNNNDSLANGLEQRLSVSPPHRLGHGTTASGGGGGGGGSGSSGASVIGGGSSIGGASGSSGGMIVDLERASSLHSPLEPNGVYMPHQQPPPNGSGGDVGAFQPAAFNMNNISATLEALNALRSGQFPAAAAAAAAALQTNFAAAAHQQQQQQQQQQQHQHQQHLHLQQPSTNSSGDEALHTPPAKRQRTSSNSGSINGATAGSTNNDELLLHDALTGVSSNCIVNHNANNHNNNNNNSPELRAFMEMQSKEHLLRMKILEVQFQAAKYNRDLVEINKTLALQKLQEYASKRLAS